MDVQYLPQWRLLSTCLPWFVLVLMQCTTTTSGAVTSEDSIFSLAHLPFENIIEEGFGVCPSAQHLGVIKMFWSYFYGALMSSILRVATSNASTGSVVSAGTVFGLDAVRMGKVPATKRGVSPALCMQRGVTTLTVRPCGCVFVGGAAASI